ncbi:MAG: signal peptidase I [Chloroflexota bacterium]
MWKRLLLLTLILSTACLAVPREIGFQMQPRFRVDGSSMRPNFPPGTIFVIDDEAYIDSLPERGDIIIFKHPRSNLDLLKRVIGLPNEEVVVRNGSIFINDVELHEPYTAGPPNYSNSWTVGENELFVLGDNRNSSSDSHSWGMLPVELVIGQATRACTENSAASCTRLEPVNYE